MALVTNRSDTSTFTTRNPRNAIQQSRSANFNNRQVRRRFPAPGATSQRTTSERNVRKNYTPTLGSDIEENPCAIFSAGDFLLPKNQCNRNYIDEDMSHINTTLIDHESSSSALSSNSSPSGQLRDIEPDFGEDAELLETKDLSSTFGSFQGAHKRVLTTGITISDAKLLLRENMKRGRLSKRGFRYRKLWVVRYVHLHGRLLKYFESEKVLHRKDKHLVKVGKLKPRGVFELTKDTTIVPLPESINGEVKYEFILYNPEVYTNEEAPETSMTLKTTKMQGWLDTLFQKIPLLTGSESVSSSDEDKLYDEQLKIKNSADVWRFQARSMKDRDDWMKAINRSINLIRRIEVAPTLAGVGSFFDHFTLDHDSNFEGFGFGSVKNATAKQSKKLFSVKAIRKNVDLVNTTYNTVPDYHLQLAGNRLYNEVKFMRRFCNNNCQESTPNPTLRLYQLYEDDFMIYMLFDRLQSKNIVQLAKEASQVVKRDLFRKAVCAVSSFHNEKIIVVNITPQTLMLSEDGLEAKVCDLRDVICVLDKKVKELTIADHCIDLSCVDYIAPETILNSTFSFKADVFALGIILAEIVVGTNLFRKSLVKPKKLTDELISQRLDTISMNANLKNLLVSMLRINPKKRSTIEEVLQHPWFNEAMVYQCDESDKTKNERESKLAEVGEDGDNYSEAATAKFDEAQKSSSVEGLFLRALKEEMKEVDE